MNLNELNVEQLKILGSAEERSRTCARAYVIDNEIPKGEQSIIEDAYRKGWFRGGLDNVKLIQQTRCYSFFNFGIGLSVGVALTCTLFVVFGGFAKVFCFEVIH